MSTRAEDTREMIVESMGQLAAGVGLSRVAGQMYALLYLSPDAVSLDDVAEKLRISKGNASVNIRELEKWGAAKKVWKKGSRKDYYAAEPDVRRIVTDRVQYGLARRLDEVSRVVDSALDALKAQEAGRKDSETAFIRERLENIKHMQETASGLLDFLGKMGNDSKGSIATKVFQRFFKRMA